MYPVAPVRSTVPRAPVAVEAGELSCLSVTETPRSTFVKHGEEHCSHIARNGKVVWSSGDGRADIPSTLDRLQ